MDTWGGLRQLAISADQSLSPAFIRTLIRSKSGALALTVALLPPLIVNTTLGFLLFTSHSFFALSLARLPFFHHEQHRLYSTSPLFQSDPVQSRNSTSDPSTSSNAPDNENNEDPINLHTLITGPTIIPHHPTLLSGLAGAGAGIVQGLAFTPVENVVHLLRESATSLTSVIFRFLRLPISPKSALSTLSIPSSPVEALRTFLSSDTWRKSPSWWTGWRWSVARDALSYGVFFAAFDITRRVGLRVKALFGGGIDAQWSEVFAINWKNDDSATAAPGQSPTVARVAQATTIVTGGVLASLGAELAGRPFKACQRFMQQAKAEAGTGPDGLGSAKAPNRVLQVWRTRGLRPFLRPDGALASAATPAGQAMAQTGRVSRVLKRVGWRMAAVGPWGFGFLVWAWVGGEV